mmetsp:Transcript_7267/g.13369  ORF Transcript_7267/g.13369 Transcript_7267/m.13369 type:complete len:312 (+) Transcript_7267:2153-3088(+)
MHVLRPRVVFCVTAVVVVVGGSGGSRPCTTFATAARRSTAVQHVRVPLPYRTRVGLCVRSKRAGHAVEVLDQIHGVGHHYLMRGPVQGASEGGVHPPQECLPLLRIKRRTPTAAGHRLALCRCRLGHACLPRHVDRLRFLNRIERVPTCMHACSRGKLVGGRLNRRRADAAAVGAVASPQWDRHASQRGPRRAMAPGQIKAAMRAPLVEPMGPSSSPALTTRYVLEAGPGRRPTAPPRVAAHPSALRHERATAPTETCAANRGCSSCGGRRWRRGRPVRPRAHDVCASAIPWCTPVTKAPALLVMTGSRPK